LSEVCDLFINYILFKKNYFFVINFHLVAIAALKRKKHLDTQLQRISGAIDKIQTQISMIEDAEHNKRIFDAMKKGGDVMKVINDSMYDFFTL